MTEWHSASDRQSTPADPTRTARAQPRHQSTPTDRRSAGQKHGEAFAHAFGRHDGAAPEGEGHDRQFVWEGWARGHEAGATATFCKCQVWTTLMMPSARLVLRG
ncbi:MAG: hypothetical protein FWD17_06235 [Polyangiaceae bacterium]|nr:hypothetical protein [Polyangiaceae bacterium]